MSRAMLLAAVFASALSAESVLIDRSITVPWIRARKDSHARAAYLEDVVREAREVSPMMVYVGDVVYDTSGRRLKKHVEGIAKKLKAPVTLSRNMENRFLTIGNPRQMVSEPRDVKVYVGPAAFSDAFFSGVGENYLAPADFVNVVADHEACHAMVEVDGIPLQERGIANYKLYSLYVPVDELRKIEEAYCLYRQLLPVVEGKRYVSERMLHLFAKEYASHRDFVQELARKDVPAGFLARMVESEMRDVVPMDAPPFVRYIPSK